MSNCPTENNGGIQNSVLSAKACIPELERTLQENIIDFWFPRCLDRKNGGYIINFSSQGEPKGEGTKMIVSQARMVWLFSRLVRAGYGDSEMLDGANLGYRFMKEKMWDQQNGGFYWEVDATGDRILKPRKHLYGQSFALYAISEYYLASRKKALLDFGIELFNLLETKSYDRSYGGYIEFWNQDWTTPPAGEANYMDMEAPDLKLMNTHLHLMEAMTAFYRASKLPLVHKRLLELITIQSNSVVRKNLGACTDKYNRNWEPKLKKKYARVSYGHDLENIWLLMDACDAAGMPNFPLLDLYKALFAYSRQYGYDEQHGGFYDSGYFLAPADQQNKTWWVQAEAIVSALKLYCMSIDPNYLNVFEKTWDFILKYHVDWKNGEWHATVTPDGAEKSDKAHIWKAGYHTGRAMVECLDMLRGLDSSRSALKGFDS